MRKLISIIFLIALVSILLAYQWYQNEISKPLTISSIYTLEVEKGQTLNGVAKQLKMDNVISHILPIKLYAKKEKIGNKIKAGEYQLDSELNIQSLLDKLVEGKVELEQLTIPEGLTFSEMLGLIHSNEHIVATLKGKSDAEIMSAIGHANEHPEGRFLPETYHFAKATDDVTVLKQSYEAMLKALDAAWKNKSPEAKLDTAYEALILASIIERETGVFDEQASNDCRCF